MEVYKKYPEEVKSLVLAGAIFSPQTYPTSSHNSLIVITNEVINLSVTCIEMILPDNSD